MTHEERTKIAIEFLGAIVGLLPSICTNDEDPCTDPECLECQGMLICDSFREKPLWPHLSRK